MNKLLLVFLVGALLVGSGCERVADVSSPHRYSKDGVSFLYPGNWNVVDDIAVAGIKYLTIESPGDAIFIVQVYSAEARETLNEFVEGFSKGFQEELPVGTVGASSTSGIKRVGKAGELIGIRQNVEILFLGENVPHVRDFFVVEGSGRVAYLVGQSAEEDFEKTEPAFEQIIKSFELTEPY